MPNVVSLASEYAPKRLQPILVTLIFVGMGAGAVLASIVGGVFQDIHELQSLTEGSRPLAETIGER